MHDIFNNTDINNKNKNLIFCIKKNKNNLYHFKYINFYRKLFRKFNAFPTYVASSFENFVPSFHFPRQ